MLKHVEEKNRFPAMDTCSLPLFNWLKARSAGLLLHPSSLPGARGVGTIGEKAHRLIDIIADAGMRYWQILPLNPTGFGDSPYSSFSAFAGNPYLISLQPLIESRLLGNEDLHDLEALGHDRVNFGGLFNIKWPVLRLAFRRFTEGGHAYLPNYGLYEDFKKKHSAWLDPYAYFMAIKAHHGGAPWYEWPAGLQTWKLARKHDLPEEVHAQAEAYRFFQYLFFGQWALLRKYAAVKNVEIVGDVPIFVSLDSADVWAEPEVFLLDRQLKPKAVSGVPPDYFSPDGQLWGNPLFNWKHLEKTGYDWWMRRMALNFDLVDVVRLDHFRGFSSFWSVPAGSPNARKGKWEPGPGLAFFKKLKERFPEARIIAEDLGDIDDDVRDLLRDTGLPGMAVLHFGFDGKPSGNNHLTINHIQNQAAYTGTHDNDTTRGWYNQISPKNQDQVRRFLRVSGEDISWDLVREAYRSSAGIAMIPAQDLLSLDTHARMNMPGTSQGNWQWRMSDEQFHQLTHHAGYLKELAWLTGRFTEPEAVDAGMD